MIHAKHTKLQKVFALFQFVSYSNNKFENFEQIGKNQL